MSYKNNLIKITSLAMLAAGVSVVRANPAIVATIENATSGTTVSVSGTYSGISGEIDVPSGVTVSGPATFEFSTTKDDGFVIGTSKSACKLESLTVTGANHGIKVTGNNNLVSGCIAHANYNDGIMIEDKAANNTISGCTSYNNDDVQNHGDNADGFGDKMNTGSGNVWNNDTCYDNADDGFDFERSSSSTGITVNNCLAYSNGTGANGNGNGFKMGYSGYSNPNTYTYCTAHNEGGSSPHGFSTNNSSDSSAIHLSHCYSYSNASADVLGSAVLTSCTMQTN